VTTKHVTTFLRGWGGGRRNNLGLLGFGGLKTTDSDEVSSNGDKKLDLDLN
jgi:hypothetical protein